MPTRKQDANVIYSAVVRRGPDISHYDVVVEDDGIKFYYLGEHWEVFRPRTGLQKRMDLLIYSMRKKRRRTSSERRPEDFEVEFCSIRELNLVKLLDRGIGRIEIKLREGNRIEIEYPLKIHEVVKQIVKRIHRGMERCTG
jgi:hypothetical protein